MIDLHIVVAYKHGIHDMSIVGVYTEEEHAVNARDMVEAPYNAYIVSGKKLNKTHAYNWVVDIDKLEAQHGNT